jgi:Cu(I)/Ag(I) efflux system protein CusF
LYSGSGTIKAIKVEGEKLIVTLAHSPIPALNWPSMVMDFEVESRDLLAGLTVGDKTNFDFKASGKTYIITDLEKQQ